MTLPESSETHLPKCAGLLTILSNSYIATLLCTGWHLQSLSKAFRESVANVLLWLSLPSVSLPVPICWGTIASPSELAAACGLSSGHCGA